MKNPEISSGCSNREVMSGNQLWTDGLICAFEFVQGHRKSVAPNSFGEMHSSSQVNDANVINKRVHRNKFLKFAHLKELEVGYSDNMQVDAQNCPLSNFNPMESYEGDHWIPIGWARISELIRTVHVGAGWSSQQVDLMDEEDDLTVADLAAAYWEHPAGPTWWCHMDAGHPTVNAWLSVAKWLHPAISTALRDESKLISNRMKHLLYEVPVRVAGGLLFELLGQSAGDPYVEEDDIPVVIRSWQAQNFLLTVQHVKGSASRINVLGITEVQESLVAGGYHTPWTIHEIIANLASHLARWDDRLFRKSIFGAADELELKFVDRRNHEDLHLFGAILNQDIRKLSKQVIRVKWSLHAREEIVFELLQHLNGNSTRSVLEGIRKSTRQMIGEQEAVRDRLFTIQDIMQSTLRAWLQDQSLTVTHNLTVFGGVGLILSIITGLFGINVDGIPGSKNTPYAFGLFAGLLLLLGIILVVLGLIYLGLKKPFKNEQIEVRKIELDELVRMFQHEAETHAQVHNHKNVGLPPTAGDKLLEDLYSC